MDFDIVGALTGAALVVVMVAGLLAPVVLIGGLFWVAIRHLDGKRTPFDRLGDGIGRANAMNSHLQASTPHPDDLAVPLPPPPGPRRRTRRRRTR
jgi:hypothetical protein